MFLKHNQRLGFLYLCGIDKANIADFQVEFHLAGRTTLNYNIYYIFLNKLYFLTVKISKKTTTIKTGEATICFPRRVARIGWHLLLLLLTVALFLHQILVGWKLFGFPPSINPPNNGL